MLVDEILTPRSCSGMLARGSMRGNIVRSAIEVAERRPARYSLSARGGIEVFAGMEGWLRAMKAWIKLEKAAMLQNSG